MISLIIITRMWMQKIHWIGMWNIFNKNNRIKRDHQTSSMMLWMISTWNFWYFCEYLRVIKYGFCVSFAYGWRMMIFYLNYVQHFYKKNKPFCCCVIFTNVFYTKIVALMLNSNEYYYLTLLPMFDVTFVMYVCMCGQMVRWIFFGWNDKKL